MIYAVDPSRREERRVCGEHLRNLPAPATPEEKKSCEDADRNRHEDDERREERVHCPGLRQREEEMHG
jgi:hypothetical protein